MPKKDDPSSTERLLGIIRNGGSGQSQSLFSVVRNATVNPDSMEPGGKNVRFCEVASPDQALQNVKQQLDAIWSNILLAKGTPPRSVLLTAASGGEGVTYVSERLSIYLARTYGLKVLYVNIADQMFSPDAPQGPSPEDVIGRLTSGEDIDGLTMATSVSGLWVLSLGIAEGPHALPWLLPGRTVMETLLQFARERFDVVVFDAQAVLSAPWTASMAKPVDVSLLVCRFAVTRREVLNALLESFRAAGVSPHGVILNDRRYSVPKSLYKRLK